MMEREKGVMSQQCGTCGNDRTVVAQPDGSVSVEACSTCSPGTEKASAATAPPVGSSEPVRQVGTSFDDDEDDDDVLDV